MLTAYEIFVGTMKIGEQILNLSFSDYQDAFDYSIENHNVVSEHMIDYFLNHSDAKVGEYEYDLIRYVFVKAMEQRIASDLYGNTARGNVCDVLHSPFDIHLQYYPTNMPKHLEAIINSCQKDAHDLAKAIYERVKNDDQYLFGVDILNAVQFIGQAYGYPIGQDNREYQKYRCSDMLTRNELNKLAGINMCRWLENNSYEILGTNFSMEACANIIAKKQTDIIHVLISSEIAPVEPGFTQRNLDDLFCSAREDGAIPYYASMSLASVNEKHFRDGVILFNDQTRYRVNAFAELILDSEN